MALENLEESEIRKIGDRPTFLGLRVSALIEIAIFFLIMIVWDLLFGNHDSFFFASPHPYWIIVILISVQYGTKEGLVATLVAIIVLLLGKGPPQTIVQDKFEYLYLLLRNPILWLIATVILGELRLRHMRERDFLKKVALSSKEKEKTITEAYESLKTNKEKLEIRVASEMQTAMMAYEAFKKLEALGADQILEGAADLIRAIVAPNRFSIFLLQGEKLQLVFCENWREDEKNVKTIASESLLFQEIIGKKRVVSVINSADRRTLENLGVLAAPMMTSNTKQVLGMIKIESIPFMRLKMPTIESLRLIGEWIGTSYGSYLEKQEAESHQYIAKSELFTQNFFQYEKEFLVNLGKRLKIDITLLTIGLIGSENLPEDKRLENLKIFRKVIERNLRTIDQAFEFEKNKVEVALLLINTSVADSEKVRSKIAADCAKELGEETDFNYRITPLYAKS
jgi:polysaccharide biosynthesis protein PelD